MAGTKILLAVWLDIVGGCYLGGDILALQDIHGSFVDNFSGSRIASKSFSFLFVPYLQSLFIMLHKEEEILISCDWIWLNL